jgi:hypothetical protein
MEGVPCEVVRVRVSCKDPISALPRLYPKELLGEMEEVAIMLMYCRRATILIKENFIAIFDKYHHGSILQNQLERLQDLYDNEINHINAKDRKEAKIHFEMKSLTFDRDVNEDNVTQSHTLYLFFKNLANQGYVVSLMDSLDQKRKLQKQIMNVQDKIEDYLNFVTNEYNITRDQYMKEDPMIGFKGWPDVRHVEPMHLDRCFPSFLGAPTDHEASSSQNQLTLFRKYTNDERDDMEDALEEKLNELGIRGIGRVQEFYEHMINLQRTCYHAMTVYQCVKDAGSLLKKYNCTGYATVPIVCEAFRYLRKIKSLLMRPKRDTNGVHAHEFLQQHPEYNLLPKDLFELLMDLNAPVPVLLWTGSNIKYADFRLHKKKPIRTIFGSSSVYNFPDNAGDYMPAFHWEDKKKCIHVFVREGDNTLPGLVCDKTEHEFVDYDLVE